ncbi:MAG: hypothetical protein A2514_02910 [Gammaproteobacteria bacterium RIFOXYD12_FULL_61_37]|nr:MAG: hypothetical protein A2514_02910 [Gammaproteobacteria bacterium RIFOXYD12_FULL_61_37]
MELPKDEIPALTHWAAPAGVEIAPEDRASVLVVDDNPAMLESVAGVIRAMGVETLTAGSGRAALRLLLQRDFALILLDVRMPVMDGFETAQLIRSRPRTMQTPIIFITAAQANDEDMLKGYAVGAVDFIHSPIATDILRAKVRVFVELHQLNRLLHRQAAALEARAEEIVSKNRQLEEVSRLKSDFLTNMSHELRTPLNAIIGFSEVLKDGLAGDLTAQQKDHVNDIYGAGLHLLSLINDILDLSKIESGRMDLDLAPVSPATLLAGSLSMIKEKAIKHHIALKLDADAAPGELLADGRKLKQIVYNLLSNALKFTADGCEIGLTARRAGRAEIGAGSPAGYATRLLPPPESTFADFLAIAVCDNGIGIGEADLGRLFQTFVQLDGSLERKYEGTGLGLALVRRLVALHGGALGVASAPGKGSCFQVWLPWREVTAEAPAEVAKSAKSAPANPLVLVTEDDPQAAAIFRHFLEDAGFRTLHAADGDDCLRLAKEARPDLISLDILMPRLGGWETLERLKADPALANIPVVIVSVLDDLKHGIALGATRVLQKPLRRDDLLDALARLGFPGKGRRKHSLLVVDDDPRIHEILARHLGGPRFRLLDAMGGQEGIDLARRAVPDLIILDMMMPGVNGFDVVETLRANPKTARIPILVLTALQLNPQERRRLNGDVEAVVEKSTFSPTDFLAEVERALGRGKVKGE